MPVHVRKRWLLGLAAALVVFGLVVANRHELLRAAIATAASLASGYTVRIADQQIGWDQMALDDVHVSHGAYPLLDAKRLDVRYSLRDLLPGSTRRFGLASIDVTNATLTVVKFKDGSYNFIIPPPSAPGVPVPLVVNTVPIRFDLRMHDAGLILREPEAYEPSAKEIRIQRFNVDATIDTATVTSYRASGTFGARREMPFTIAGRIDAIRSFAMHRAQAKRFPLRQLANYFADTPVVRILRGGARNFDARLWSLDVRPNLPSSYHVNLNLDIDGGRIALSALAAPLDDMHGHLELVDNACFLRSMDGTLTGIPLHVSGGIFDLTGDLTGNAQLRLGVYGTGDIAKLRNAFAFTKSQPVSGKIRLGVLVEGPIDNPIIVADANAARTVYRDLPFDGLHAGVIYHDNLVALAPLHAYYGGTEVGIHGSMVIGKQLHSEVALHVSGSADRLPYLDQMLGREPMLVDGAANGDDLNFRVVASAASARGVDRVAAIVELNKDGTGRIDPFWLHTELGSVDGGYYLNRPTGDSGFWALAGNLHMHLPTYPAFPGLDLPKIPEMSGTIGSAAVAGGGSGNHVVLAGSVTGGKSEIAGVKFDRITAGFAGTMAGAQINVLHAAGPWGSFDGAGGFSSQAFVARGDYRGTFEGLQPFLTDAIPAHGALAGPAAIAVAGNRIVVQASHLRMRNATLRGVPVDDASITLAVDGDRLHVYSAHARAAGGDVVAAGTFSVAKVPQANSGSLSLVVRDLNAAQLKGIGLPLDGGRLWASGDLSAGAPIPTFDGGVSLANARMQHYPLAGGGDVHLQGDAAHLSRVVGALGPAYAIVGGTIGSLSSGKPSYGLDATVPAGPVAATLRALAFPSFETDGSFNARLHIGGYGVAPTVGGAIAVPAGDVNGLPFTAAHARLAADTRGVAVDRGRVQVGSTNLHFSAEVRPEENRVAVSSDRADLEDFNNFFDTGDTLDGEGRLRFAATQAGRRFTTAGNIDVTSFRYRNLPIGDTKADWSSARGVVSGALAVGGTNGLLRAHGSIGVVPEPALFSALEHARYDLTANVSDLDLSLWTAVLGFHSVPLTGRASGDATLKGTYPQLALRGDARVDGGTIGPLTLERAAIAVHSQGSRLTIDSSELQTSGLSATATGSLGLLPSAPLDLQVHAETSDLPRLIYQVARVKVPVSGAFESTLQIGGTYRAPTFAAGVDATDVQAYGLSIASLFGEVKLQGKSLVLSNAGASFSHGEATLAGSVPLQLSPLRFGEPNQPVSFDVDVTDLDPAMFDGILGNNTKLGGTIAGHIGISGTVGAPIVIGRATLQNGSYVSDLERTPIAKTVATLSFNRTSAAIEQLTAQLGDGSLRGSGKVDFPTGFTANGMQIAAAITARGAQLNLPTFGSGTIDAEMTLSKAAQAQAVLGGNVTLTNSTLAFSAFVNAAQQGSNGGGLPLPPFSFDLRATAGKNVRVRGNGYGAGLDLGATGSVRLAGTLAAPTLDGSFVSTGGTLTYFDRAFRVSEGAVHFSPADGLIPNIHAVANTNVVNPDPDRARNPYGSAQITINVDGPIDGLKIGFTTNPPGYTRDQIIAMIAPFGGFINGIGFTNQSALAVQSPGGITPLGAVNPVPNGVYQTQNGKITVGQEAFNILNAQFTAGLLAPVENALGQGLGLSSVNLTLGYYGNVGVSATRVLGKAVSAIYATTFGLPQITSFGIQINPSANTSATLSYFYQTGPTTVYQSPVSAVGPNGQVLVGQPLLGNSGFSFTLKRYY